MHDRVAYLKKEVIERVIFRDIPEVTKIKNPQLTQRLLTFGSLETANVISYQNLSAKLGARFETLTEHLFYLEYSFLASLFKKYSKGGLSMAKSQPKLNISDPSIILALTNKVQSVFAERDFLGRLVESVVATTLRFAVDYENLFYWRDAYSEVDIVYNLGTTPLPIEVKYKNNFAHKDLAGITHFRQKYKIEQAVILIEDYFGKDDEVFFLPTWFFLLGKVGIV